MSPSDKMPERLDASSEGPYQALGKLKDKGFVFGRLEIMRIPTWVQKKFINAPYYIHGVCSIVNFPISHEIGSKHSPS